MPSVLVTIAGRSYRMACDDGEEKRLEELAAAVDAKIQGMKSGFGDIGDQRIVVMAAVAIADEAHDAKSKIEALEAEKAELLSSRDSEIAAIVAGRDAEIADLKAARDAEVSVLRAQKEAETSALRARNEAETSALRAELEKARKEFEAQRDVLAQRFDAAAVRVERLLADLRSGGGEV